MATIFLTSTGISSPAVHDAFVQERKSLERSAPVIIITTASKQGSTNPYIQKAYQQFVTLGFSNVRFFDLLTDTIESLKTAAIIYVGGGNTFRLLKALKDSGADQILRDFCEQSNGIYVGVSAGSLIVGQSIASAVGHDDNNVNLTDLTGLRIVPYLLLVHYTEKDAEDLTMLEQNFPKVRTLTDSQAIIHQGENEQLI